MTDSLKLAEMQRTSIEFERQRHLANWFIKSSPHMATPPQTAATTTTTSAAGATATTTALSGGGGITPNGTGHSSNATSNNTTSATAITTQQQQQQSNTKHHNSNSSNNTAGGSGGHNSNVFYLMSSNGNTGAVGGVGGGNSSGHTNGKHSNGGASPALTATPSSSSAAAAAAAAAMCTVSGPSGAGALGHLHVVEGRKPKLRRFNSHDTSSNMFSVADFENARLARRNEIEMKQRLQRRMRMSANGGYAGDRCGDRGGSGSNGLSSTGGGANGGGGYGSGGGSMGGDYSTGDSKASKYSNDSQHEPLAADIFLDRYSLPRVVRISYKTKFSDETLQSSSSNGSSTVTSTSNSSSAASGTVGINSAGGNSSGGGAGGSGTATSSSTASSNVNVNHHHHHHQHHHHNNTTGSGSTKTINNTNANVASSATAAAAATVTQQSTINGSNADVLEHQDQGELFLLYRLIRQRHIYHGYNAKTAATNRKKGVLIPQEFPGYFSLLNEKSLPTATLYTSLIQLVRERVFKFVSVDNMPAFTESQPNVSNPPTNEGCMPTMYSAPSQPPTNNRPQYVKTTARGGQVFRLLAVFEDGKQDHNAIGSSGTSGSINAKPNSSHGREKEKGRYAQLLNESRQVLYVSLSTKGKFYEIEPGIPQILQKLGGMTNDANKKVNPDCVHRITAMVTPNKELPLTLRYISGPNGCTNAIPENVCITRITTENVMIACPIEDQVEVQSPLHLRKLHLTKEMNLLKSFLGFESEQRMFANPNVQNILKFCQFNCDQFLKMVEVEILHRPERSGSKSRVDGLKILKPLHLPKLLRREKTTISAHEKEDSIIFLSKSDLASLEAKEAAAVAANAGIESSGSGGGGVPTTSGSGNRISEKMKVFQSTKKKWFRKQDKHAVVNSSLTSFDLDVQAKRMSMERYSDMSKLLQERFGDKSNSLSTSQEHESISEPSGASDIGGCSDTETTTLATIEEKLKKFSHSHHKCNTSSEPMLQKSMSLQDIELIGGGGGGGMNGSRRKPDILAHADTISEAGTDLEDLENQTPIPQSFITEKLYNEFHVKTRQYSKSSSSLHQLLNFSLPQKLQTHHDTKRSLAQIKHNGAGTSAVGGGGSSSKFDRRLDFNIGEPVTGRRAAGGLCLLAATGSSATSGGNSQNTSLISPLTPTSLIEDDLPYSSVRDSLVLSSDESASENAAGNICQALNLIDYAKENIYAEICHDASGMGSGGGGGGGAVGGIPNSQTRDTFSSETHSTQISDDYGDYASLTYPTYQAQNQQQHLAINNGIGNGFSSTSSNSNSSTTGNAISRVQINCSSSPVSYHTVYLGDEPLGEQHYPTAAAAVAAAAERRRKAGVRDDSSNHHHHQQHHHHMRSDRSHVTTVELEGNASGTGASLRGAASSDLEAVDNIYNTLK